MIIKIMAMTKKTGISSTNNPKTTKNPVINTGEMRRTMPMMMKIVIAVTKKRKSTTGIPMMRNGNEMNNMRTTTMTKETKTIKVGMRMGLRIMRNGKEIMKRINKMVKLIGSNCVHGAWRLDRLGTWNIIDCILKLVLVCFFFWLQVAFEKSSVVFGWS